MGFLGRLSSTASTLRNAFPSIDNVMMAVQTGPMRSTVTMKNSLTLDIAAFADVRERATTGSHVAGTVAVFLLQMAIGSKDSSSSSEMEVVADPVKYAQIMGAVLGSAGSMLVARMKTER
jgi:hypothetical protein